MEERQSQEHLRRLTDKAKAQARDGHPLARLLLLLRLEALCDEDAIAETNIRVRSSAMHAVVSSLLRTCTSANPSGEPDNAEAKRQIIFFCNSLQNRRLRQPPPVIEMKSLSVFTPHYSEDVTYSMEALQTAGDDNASVRHRNLNSPPCAGKVRRCAERRP